MNHRPPHDRRRDDIGKAFRRQTAIKWTARGLFVLAIAIAAQHLVAHAGYRPIPIGMGAQDLFIGYPTAAVAGIVALVIWGRKPAP